MVQWFYSGSTTVFIPSHSLFGSRVCVFFFFASIDECLVYLGPFRVPEYFFNRRYVISLFFVSYNYVFPSDHPSRMDSVVL